MAAKIKRRFRGWLFFGIICAGMVFMFIFFAAPMLEYVRKIFPGMQKISDKNVSGGETEIGAAGQQEENKAVPVVVFKAVKSDFEDTLPAMGTIKGNKEIELRFETNGVIEAINFKEGDFLRGGDTIAALNQQDVILKLEYAQSKLKTSQAQMLTAKKKLEIHQKLYQLGTIIKSKFEEVALEYENAKSQAASAEKEVAFARQEIQKAYLTSPIDGIIGSRETEPGEFVTSNTKIATLIDIASVFAEVGIIEKDMQKVSLGQEATVTVDAYPDKEFKGAIDNILPVIEGRSRTLTCKIKIKNDESQLLPGMFARATIFVFGQKGVFVISNPSATLRDKDNDGKLDSVFIIDEENTARLKDVEISYITTDNAVITAGVEEGDLIVTEARAELNDGSVVEILETQEGINPAEQPMDESAKAEKEIVIQ